MNYYEFHFIQINSSVQDKQRQEQTFLHEVVNGIVHEASLELINSDEQTIINEIAIGLHQIVRDNAAQLETLKK